MKNGILIVVLTANALALLTVFSPWGETWSAQGAVFLAVEAAGLMLVGAPLFVHYRRKGLSCRDACAAMWRAILDGMAGWI